jgi:hypothetical protein
MLAKTEEHAKLPTPHMKEMSRLMGLLHVIEFTKEKMTEKEKMQLDMEKDRIIRAVLSAPTSLGLIPEC